MTQGHTELAQLLRTFADALGAWEPDAHTALEGLTATLQTILPQAPETMPELRALLQLELEGLSALPHLDRHDQQELVETLVTALAAGEHWLLAADNLDNAFALDEAARGVLCALGRDPADWPPTVREQVPPPLPAAQLSLDDIAAVLMQLEPTDTAELMRVRDALHRMATAETGGTAYLTTVHKLVGEAAKKLDLIVRGKTSEPQNALTEAGWLIEGATEALAESTTASAQRLTPAPPPASPPEGHAAVLLPEVVDVELVGDFITECREYIESAEAALLTLETTPDDMESVNTVFRAFHTIKGTAAFLGLTLIADFAHHAESLLSRMRDRVIRCSGGYADLALHAVDALKELMQALQDALGGAPGVAPDGLAELQRLLADPEAAGISEDSIDAIAPPPPRLGDILVARGKILRTDVEDAAMVPPRLGDILVAQGRISREEAEAAAVLQGEMPIGVTLVRAHSASVSDVARAIRIQQHIAKGEQAVESSVRVRTDRLDRLIDMVGELVIAHAMVAQDEVALHGGHHELLKKITHAGKIVRELQDLSMSMRMVPFRATFQKMARVVRDVAQKSRKEVCFLTEGEDTEIDRNMVDVISDPLVHMVRNAVDHGIEPPEGREAQDKPRAGTVRLSAYHAGGNVVVELQDDGKGICRDKIVEKAIARGLIESDKGLSDNDVFNLIFEPGFSTAEQITDVSGRGVGMDVVKRSLEALKGRIDIASETGKGTTFAIHLPLTLAITDGMLVRVGRERYIIPTINIYKSFRPGAEALSTVSGRGELVMLRDELIPLFRLHRLFDVTGAIEDPTHGLLVVVNDGERHCALLVDELLGQQQVVAKSLGPGLGNVPGISGAAILGDGRVGLILDPSGLVTLARQVPTGNGTGATSRVAA
jgi:two-component system chemotaxis sensor kinase CheA